jgi:hypothetical protein
VKNKELRSVRALA